MVERAQIQAVLATALAACGYPELQAIPDAMPDAMPDAWKGEHYHYIVDSMRVPTSNVQARDYGLDLNGDTTVDNQLGMVLSTLGSMGLEFQKPVEANVAEGRILQLVDFQTSDFTSAPLAGIQVYLGDDQNVQPLACNGGEMYNTTTLTGCRHHLDGTGRFAIDALSPTNAPLDGPIVDGTFTGGPGSLALQIAFTGPIQIDLIGARVKATGLTDTALGTGPSGLVFAGAMPKTAVDSEFIPALQQQMAPVIVRDCNMLASPPDCGCTTDSTGKTLLGLFDTKLASGVDGKDCAVSVDEIKGNSLIVSLLAPDLQIDGTPALSFGVKATAIKATFTAPGQ